VSRWRRRLQGGLGAFEGYRLSQVNASVTEQRLDALRDQGFICVYADVATWTPR
jgi:hypothetical protein